MIDAVALGVGEVRVRGSAVGGRGGGEVGLADAEEVLVEGGDMGVLVVRVTIEEGVSQFFLFSSSFSFYKGKIALGKRRGIGGALQFDMPL